MLDSGYAGANFRELQLVEEPLGEERIRHSLWAHHNSTTSAWRSMGFGGGPRLSAPSKNRLD